jgi:hypothetical protein
MLPAISLVCVRVCACVCVYVFVVCVHVCVCVCVCVYLYPWVTCPAMITGLLTRRSSKVLDGIWVGCELRDPMKAQPSSSLEHVCMCACAVAACVHVFNVWI